MRNSEKSGALYLCQFSQGTIKIGIGADAAVRLAAHKAAAAVFGITVVRTDVIPCELPRKAEKLLIEWCARNSTACNGREWFNGVNYEACLAAANSASLAMMGPHPARGAAKDFLQGVIEHFKGKPTKEAALYRDVREMMLRNEAPYGVLAAFDYLHRESEVVRANQRAGGAAPEWYDLLNCFELWELELWFDSGKPSSELLRASAEAIDTLARMACGKEVAHA